MVTQCRRRGIPFCLLWVERDTRAPVGHLAGTGARHPDPRCGRKPLRCACHRQAGVRVVARSVEPHPADARAAIRGLHCTCHRRRRGRNRDGVSDSVGPPHVGHLGSVCPVPRDVVRCRLCNDRQPHDSGHRCNLGDHGRRVRRAHALPQDIRVRTDRDPSVPGSPWKLGHAGNRSGRVCGQHTHAGCDPPRRRCGRVFPRQTRAVAWDSLDISDRYLDRPGARTGRRDLILSVRVPLAARAGSRVSANRTVPQGWDRRGRRAVGENRYLPGPPVGSSSGSVRRGGARSRPSDPKPECGAVTRRRTLRGRGTSVLDSGTR